VVQTRHRDRADQARPSAAERPPRAHASDLEAGVRRSAFARRHDLTVDCRTSTIPSMTRPSLSRHAVASASIDRKSTSVRCSQVRPSASNKPPTGFGWSALRTMISVTSMIRLAGSNPCKSFGPKVLPILGMERNPCVRNGPCYEWRTRHDSNVYLCLRRAASVRRNLNPPKARAKPL
jgi:hypothetical protein